MKPIFQNPLVGGYLWAWLTTVALSVCVTSLIGQHRKMRRISADLEQAQQRLTALHKIALSLSTTVDVNRLLETVLTQLENLWGYNSGGIFLLDDATGDLVLAAARDYIVPIGYRIPRGSGICGAVAESGQPLNIQDVTNDPRYLPGLTDAASELAVPLIWEGRTLGVLNVESRQNGAYGQEDVTLLTTVGEQAAASIGNARLHQTTRRMAITDAHTGLYNYRHFQDEVAAAVRAAQVTGSEFALVMADLDALKRVNDTYGHPTGDHVLQQVSRVLREHCRQQDLVFRYGGDEFALILPNTGRETAAYVAERIREQLANQSFVTASGRRLDFPVTASFGVSCYPHDGMTAVDIVLAADKHLYVAKAEGRNRVVWGAERLPAQAQ